MKVLQYLNNAISLSVIAVIGWAIKINSRVAVVEAQHGDLKELISARFDASDNRLDRIERALNGRLSRE